MLIAMLEDRYGARLLELRLVPSTETLVPRAVVGLESAGGFGSDLAAVIFLFPAL